MIKKLDTTFSQCPHGTPKCERCKNIRIIQWIKVTDELPRKNQRYLVMFDNLEPDVCIGFSSFSTETKEFNHTNITHWADISGLEPITTCEHSGIQFNENGETVGFV